MWRRLSAVVISLAAFLLCGSVSALESRTDPHSFKSHAFLAGYDRFETCAKQSQQGKSKPVIGILTVPNLDDSPEFAILGAGRLWKPYVDWFEAEGADIVPLPYEASHKTLTKLLSDVNGVVFTGGHHHFYLHGKLTVWGHAAMHIWNHVVASHQAGKPLPLWATCLGFEFMHFAASGEKWTPFVSHFQAKNTSLKEHFTPYAAGSRLMNGKCAPPALQSTLASQPLAFHAHEYGIEPSQYDNHQELRSKLNIVSTSHGPDGREFVSMVEGKDGLPVYGTQWHPEKNEFLTSSSLAMNKSPEAIEATRYFSHFFVEEARRNSNHFHSLKERAKALIGNYFKIETPVVGQEPEMYYVGSLKKFQWRLLLWRLLNNPVAIVFAAGIFAALARCWFLAKKKS
eukprot:TRINITY_DN932_c0_g1_i1.p1 TRINITY_DN932_c0_g1~~TRINITY_DN932_c0_g1_i1.p1  ORF type:complete len:399 (+),score=51.84 TRINITY_DN932_c0_g1_i1:156-1352(+)